MAAITIVGEAELDIRAVGASFSGDINRVVRPGVAQVGTSLDQAAGHGGRAFGMMWGAFTQSANGALGPVTEMVDHVQNVTEELHSKSLAMKATAIGASGLGISTGLQMYGSKEVQAHGQLQAAIENTGHVWEDYASQIEDAIAAGHRLGVHNYDTMDALNRLTVATRNPAVALRDYNVVLAMSAARHMSVTSAAQVLGSAYGGNTRVFRMFGDNMAAGNVLLTNAAKATKTHTSAVDALKKARQSLSDTEARIGAARQGQVATASQLASAEAAIVSARSAKTTADFEHGAASPQAAAAAARLTAAEARLTELRGKGSSATKLSVSQQIELRKAHEAVAAAQDKVKTSATDMAAAHKAAAGATSDVQTHVDGLGKRLDGQYSAAVHNFGTEIRAFGVDLEDALGGVGAKYGPGLTAISTGVLATGVLAQTGVGIFSRFSSGGRAAIAMNKTFAEVTAVEVEAANAQTEGNLASLRAQVLLDEEAMSASAEGAATASATAWTTADTEISTSIGTTAAEAEAEFTGMAAGAETASAATATSWAGAMTKLNLGLVGFTTAYMATTELLKHTPLGKWVAEGADSIAKLLGLFPDTNPYHKLKDTPQFGTGKLQGYVFGPEGYFDAQGHRHSWKNAPHSLDEERDKWTAPQRKPQSLTQVLDPRHGHHHRHVGGGLGGLFGDGHDGSHAVVRELQVSRHDTLQIVHGINRLIKTVEEQPSKAAALASRGQRQWSSPELLTL